MKDELNKALCSCDDAVRDSLGNTDFLEDLGLALRHRIQELGDVNDITRYVSVMEDLVRLTADAGPAKPGRLCNLGNSLLFQFNYSGNLADLNRSVTLREDAVQLTPDGHSDKPSRLTNLAVSFLTRFEHLGNLDDLNRSMSLQESALSLSPEGHPDKPSMLQNLGNSFLICFEQLGDMEDLNRSVCLHEDAIHLTPNGDPDKLGRENNLGGSLFRCFEHCGDLADLNWTVSFQQDAVRLTPAGHPEKLARLSNLGYCLLTRFVCLGDLDDLNRSVVSSEDAVNLTTDKNPSMPWMLNNLGNSLAIRFERLGCLDDLKRSVAMHQDAVNLTPDGNPDKPSILSFLGVSFSILFQHVGDIADLNTSIMLQEAAVRLTPEGHPGKLSWLNNLGKSLFIRFESLSDLDDLNRSVLLQENVVHLTPEGHPDKPSCMSNLGDFFIAHFKHLGNRSDLQKSVLDYSSAARSTTGSTHIRFPAATMWAGVEDPPACLDVYHVALGLLPELAWFGLSISDRHYLLLKAGKVVREAVAAALTSYDLQQAMEWLKQGRSVIWGQLLSLRSPVDTLKQRHPDLANKLCSLSISWRPRVLVQVLWKRRNLAPSRRSSLFHSRHMKMQMSQASEADTVTAKILEGFERLLLPKTISELSPAAQQDPVIILNMRKNRCDALILVPRCVDNKVMHIALPDFKPEDAEELSKSFQTLVPSSARNDRLSGHREGRLLPGDEFAHILSELWHRLVKPVLDGLVITVSHRIWWCPTGPLTFLPIHAAGLYGKDDTFGSKLSDYVISSYTPSLNALIEGFRPQSESKMESQLLAVAQPSAARQSYIPGTQEELDHIQRLATGKFPVLRLDGTMATLDSVQQGMRDSSWVHFACHGVQETSEPTESALLVAQHSRLPFPISSKWPSLTLISHFFLHVRLLQGTGASRRNQSILRL
ncbi:CHAT domain-containing protein [Mycena vulgaris]|nr:CHAT domain-containing protein [Mycena vulgaris]